MAETGSPESIVVLFVIAVVIASVGYASRGFIKWVLRKVRGDDGEE